MAGSLNKVILIGNVGSVELKATKDAKEWSTISLATSESWKDKKSGERKEKTEWHRIVVWNEGLVNVIKNYVNKGSKLYIEGHLQTRKYEQDGQTKYSTEIVLQGFNSQLIMLDKKDSNGEVPKRKESTFTPPPATSDFSEEDLNFDNALPK
tara:strand:- start:834 stop:1289 length:456 start_codon:yes stop_codon:yes gene_type:complete